MMFKKFIFLSVLFISSCFADYKYQLSIGTIFRDEAPYLREWIEFHKLIGVEYFYLCNHNSVDNYQEVLQPYIDQGIVELTNLYENPNANHGEFCYGMQVNWYNQCLSKCRSITKWIAFLDADEFLCPVEKNSVTDFLKDFEEFGGVSVNWLLFGSSQVPYLSSNKLMIEQLTACASYDYDGHTFVKTIVQPECVVRYGNPHFAGFQLPFYPVNPNKELLTTPARSKVVLDKLRVNHYWTRAEDHFWNIKIPRQIQLYGGADFAINQYHEFNKSKDLVIQRFVPALREKMGLD